MKLMEDLTIKTYTGLIQFIKTKLDARKEQDVKTLREVAETERGFNSLCPEYKDMIIKEVCHDLYLEHDERDHTFY